MGILEYIHSAKLEVTNPQTKIFSIAINKYDYLRKVKMSAMSNSCKNSMSKFNKRSRKLLKFIIFK